MKIFAVVLSAAVAIALVWGFATGSKPVPDRSSARATAADAAWYAALPVDPAAATAAFLARVPADARAQATPSAAHVTLRLRCASRC